MSMLNINIEELLKELEPATLQALEQLLAEDVPAVRKTIQNILDEPISEKVEKSLNKPLIPKTFQPTAPPRKRGRHLIQFLEKLSEMLQTIRMRFLIYMTLPNMREKKKEGDVTSAGASLEALKKILHQTL